MTDKEREEWVALKITKDTFKKTAEEKLTLKKAKLNHREFLRSSSNNFSNPQS